MEEFQRSTFIFSMTIQNWFYTAINYRFVWAIYVIQQNNWPKLASFSIFGPTLDANHNREAQNCSICSGDSKKSSYADIAWKLHDINDRWLSDVSKPALFGAGRNWTIAVYEARSLAGKNYKTIKSIRSSDAHNSRYARKTEPRTDWESYFRPLPCQTCCTCTHTLLF